LKNIRLIIAAFVGFIVAAATYVVLGMAISLAIYFVYIRVTAHTTQQLLVLRDGPVFWALSVAVIFAGAMAGAYVATRLSRTANLAAAVIVGVALAATQLGLALWQRGGPAPWWIDAVIVLIMLPAAIAGGRLAAAGPTSGST
jgi:hypothetical protein